MRILRPACRYLYEAYKSYINNAGNLISILIYTFNAFVWISVADMWWQECDFVCYLNVNYLKDWHKIIKIIKGIFHAFIIFCARCAIKKIMSSKYFWKFESLTDSFSLLQNYLKANLVCENCIILLKIFKNWIFYTLKPTSVIK